MLHGIYNNRRGGQSGIALGHRSRHSGSIPPDPCALSRLQAIRWEGTVYIDPMLPFGLRSAPKIFNAEADALHWCLHHEGIPGMISSSSPTQTPPSAKPNSGYWIGCVHLWESLWLPTSGRAPPCALLSWG